MLGRISKLLFYIQRKSMVIYTVKNQKDKKKHHKNIIRDLYELFGDFYYAFCPFWKNVPFTYLEQKRTVQTFYVTSHFVFKRKLLIQANCKMKVGFQFTNFVTDS